MNSKFKYPSILSSFSTLQSINSNIYSVQPVYNGFTEKNGDIFLNTYIKNFDDEIFELDILVKSNSLEYTAYYVEDTRNAITDLSDSVEDKLSTLDKGDQIRVAFLGSKTSTQLSQSELEFCEIGIANYCQYKSIFDLQELDELFTKNQFTTVEYLPALYVTKELINNETNK